MALGGQVFEDYFVATESHHHSLQVSPGEYSPPAFMLCYDIVSYSYIAVYTM